MEMIIGYNMIKNNPNNDDANSLHHSSTLNEIFGETRSN